MSFADGTRWHVRCKDAGSPDMGHIGATEDAAACVPSAFRRHKGHSETASR